MPSPYVNCDLPCINRNSNINTNSFEKTAISHGCEAAASVEHSTPSPSESSMGCSNHVGLDTPCSDRNSNFNGNTSEDLVKYEDQPDSAEILHNAISHGCAEAAASVKHSVSSPSESWNDCR